MPRSRNPFQVTALPTEAEFCDRRRELAQVEDTWDTPGAKLVLYGERRLGKSAVLQLAAARANRARRPVVVFSLATAIDVPDAIQRLVRAVHHAIGRSWKTLIQDLAAKLRFTVTMAPRPDGGGLPEFSLGVDPGAQPLRSGAFTDALDAVEAELARRKLRLGLGIDEFQRLLAWGGEDVEWALKASLEQHRHLSYVLAGSARSLIEEMVTNKDRALWKAVDTLAMGPIAPEEFAAWIVRRCRGTGVSLSRTVAERIVSLAGPRTRDVIVLARATWEDARANGGEGDPLRALTQHVASTSDLYERVWRKRTERERRVLRLLAAEPEAELTSDAVRGRHRLGAPSTVARALEALIDDEVLARADGRYVYDDPFFRSWVAQATDQRSG